MPPEVKGLTFEQRQAQATYNAVIRAGGSPEDAVNRIVFELWKSGRSPAQGYVQESVRHLREVSKIWARRMLFVGAFLVVGWLGWALGSGKDLTFLMDVGMIVSLSVAVGFALQYATRTEERK